MARYNTMLKQQLEATPTATATGSPYAPFLAAVGGGASTTNTVFPIRDHGRRAIAQPNTAFRGTFEQTPMSSGCGGFTESTPASAQMGRPSPGNEVSLAWPHRMS